MHEGDVCHFRLWMDHDVVGLVPLGLGAMRETNKQKKQLIAAEDGRRRTDVRAEKSSISSSSRRRCR